MKKNICFLIITIICELTIFNASMWKSIGNKEVDLTPCMYCEGTNVYISSIDMPINNIRIEASVMPNEPIPYKVIVSDEGNYYEYCLGEGVISYSDNTSKYCNIHAYGNVRSLTIEFSEDAQPNFENLKIMANSKRPLAVNIWRMAIIYVLLSFVWGVRSSSDIMKLKLFGDEETNKSKESRIKLTITIVFMLLWIVLGLYWSSSHLLLDEASKPHHQQYKELATALCNGSVVLNHKPSEGLLNAPNPYDTIYLQANGIDYLADYAYYNGNYYVYFGITPELLIYLPYHILTGRDFPNHAAVFVFYALFVVGVFFLLREIIRRYVPETSFIVYLIVASAIVTAGSYSYLFFTADLYCVPVMAGIALTSIGLWFWMAANRLSKNILYLLGSLSMACVAGCRPQMLIFSFLAVPILYDTVFKERRLFSKKSISTTICFVLPYILVAGIVMYYNAARFGSVFDFGATYSLTNNDMNLRGFSISRMLLGLMTFLFGVPNVDTVFPFIHTSNLNFNYMGKIVTEHYFGGIITTNILTWILFTIGYYRREIKNRKLGILLIILMVGSVIIGLLDANTAGVLVRYASDMSFGIMMATAIMLLVAASRMNPGVISFIKAGAILGLSYSFMIICNVDTGITLRQYNPDLYYAIASIFRI